MPWCMRGTQREVKMEYRLLGSLAAYRAERPAVGCPGPTWAGLTDRQMRVAFELEEREESVQRQGCRMYKWSIHRDAVLTQKSPR